MRYDFMVAVLLYCIASFLILVAVFVFTKKEILLGIKIVGLLAVANVLFLVGNASIIMSDRETPILINAHLELFGASFLSFFWFIISSQQKTKSVKISIKKLSTLLAIPILCCFSLLLYPWFAQIGQPDSIHLLFYQGHELVENVSFGEGFVGISFKKGIFFYVLVSFNLLMYLLAGYNYFITYKNSLMSDRRNSLVLIVTTLVLFLISISKFIFSNTAYITFEPFVSSAAVLIVFYALYKYELFDLSPLAYRQVYEEASFPVFILDKNKYVLSMNEEAKELYSHQFDAIERLTLDDIFEKDHICAKCLFEFEGYEIAVSKDRDKIYFSAKLEELFRYSRLKGYLLTYRDITSHKMEMKKMEYMATYDDLTQIYNRRVFYVKATEDFDESVINKSPVSYIMFDLDDFKDVNDIYGHQAGDYVLAEMAKLVSKELDERIIFARYGGEEFIMSVKNTGPEETYEIANKIRKTLEKHSYVYTSHRIKVTASFGVAGTNKQITKSFEHFLKDADDALYQSKKNGKNQVSIKE